MPDNISKYNEQRRAELALAHAEDMAQRALQAVEDAKRAVEATKLPKSPGAGSYSMSVRFEPGGIKYTFLVLISPTSGVYTTAIKDGGKFASFRDFAQWIRNRKPYYCSPLEELAVKAHGSSTVIA